MKWRGERKMKRSEREPLTIAEKRSRAFNDKKFRLFACWCMRQVWHKLNKKSKKCVEVIERYAVGEANKKELKIARKSVTWNAVWRAASCVTKYVVLHDAWNVASDVSWKIACDVAKDDEELEKIYDKMLDEMTEMLNEV